MFLAVFLLPVSSQNKRVSLKYERKLVWLISFLTSQRDIFRDFYTRHLHLVMPSYGTSKGCFVKMYIKCGYYGGHDFQITKDAKVTLFWPLCKVYVKQNVQDTLYTFIQQIYCIFLLDLRVFVTKNDTLSWKENRNELSSPEAVAAVSTLTLGFLPHTVFLRHKWQGWTCQHYGAATPTTSHSNGA